MLLKSKKSYPAHCLKLFYSVYMCLLIYLYVSLNSIQEVFLIIVCHLVSVMLPDV